MSPPVLFRLTQGNSNCSNTSWISPSTKLHFCVSTMVSYNTKFYRVVGDVMCVYNPRGTVYPLRDRQRFSSTGSVSGKTPSALTRLHYHRNLEAEGRCFHVHVLSSLFRILSPAVEPAHLHSAGLLYSLRLPANSPFLHLIFLPPAASTHQCNTRQWNKNKSSSLGTKKPSKTM